MEYFEIALSYEWEYDEDFISLAENILQKAGISTFIIKEFNVAQVTALVKNRKLGFGFYLDRASDVDPAFEPLAKMLSRKKTRILNPYKNVAHAIDKASMHLEFITAGLNVPYSIIIAPKSEMENIYISVDDLARLGRPFIIKPCNTTGGGMGVVTGAETLKDVLAERATNINDKYLIQEKIYPDVLEGRRAWFRCFWAFGKAIPAWWDDQTHIYEILSPEQTSRYNLKKLASITRTIAAVTKLDFFSTEIVLTPDNNFIVIDYVNDQCDMRFKSRHPDGVPDPIIMSIVESLRKMILKSKKDQSVIKTAEQTA